MSKKSVKNKRTEKLRSEILYAASGLFRKKGFLATTLNEVSNGVGISQANIYNYFQNKQFLLYELLSESAKAVINTARIIQTSSSSPKIKLEQLIRMHIIWCIDPNRCISAFELRNMTSNLRRRHQALRDEYEEIYRNVLNEAISVESIRDCDVALTVRLMLGLLNSVPLWFKHNGVLSPENLADEIVNLMLHGIGFVEDEERMPVQSLKRGA